MSVQKKVTFLTRLYLPHIGGVERHIQGLLPLLKDKGYDVTIVTQQHEMGLTPKEVIHGVHVIRMPQETTESKLGLWQWMHEHSSLFVKSDIIHVHDVMWWLVPLMSQLDRSRVSLTIHGYDPSSQLSARQKTQFKLLASYARSVLGVGSFIAAHYGIRLDAVTYGAAEAKPTSVEGKGAVYLGRLSGDTGIQEYMQVIQNMDGTLPLDVYGTGILEARLRASIKKHRLPVALHGTTNQPLKVMRHAQYVFSSQYLSMLEAMQVKKLVCTMRASTQLPTYLFTHPQIHNTLLGISPADLAIKLHHLPSEKEEEMIHTAYTWAKKQTWATLADTYEKLWHA